MRFWPRKHKHNYKFKGRDRFGMYLFECKKCRDMQSRYPHNFWQGAPINKVAIWLWNNS